MEISNHILAWIAAVLCFGSSTVIQLAIYALITGREFSYICKRLTAWGWIFFILTIAICGIGVLFIVSLFIPELWQLLQV
jgi:hypothetical protein